MIGFRLGLAASDYKCVVAVIVAFFALEPSGSLALGQDAGGLTDEQLAAIAALPTIRGRANPRLQIERTPSQRITGTFTAKATTPSMKVDTWVFITPTPPNLDGQEVIDVQPRFPAESIHDLLPLERSLLRSRIKVDSAELESSCNYSCQVTVKLFSRSLKPKGRRSPDVKELEPAERRLYLRPDKTFNYTSESFRTWKTRFGFHRTPRESEVDFAQRVFRTITNHYEYLYDPKQGRSASQLCETNRTDCGGMSILFATVLRSEAIPARTLVGRWAESAETDSGPGRDDRFHTIAEFYAEGIGWIPVDGSSAVLHDPTPQKLEFFGNQSGDFLTLHLDHDLTFETGLWGEHETQFFQVPKFWFRGQGKFDDVKFEHDWSVTGAEPAEATAGDAELSMNPPEAERSYVFLPLKHVRQQERLCAPTSASIVLLRYGLKVPPLQVKQLANSVSTDKAFPGTYFKDLTGGLRKLGLKWKNQSFTTDAGGFFDGIVVIERSLRSGHPVLVDTFVAPNGHTVVVNGIDPNRELVSLVDPNLPAPGIRRMTFAEFEQIWRSKTSDVRGCILTAPPAP